VSIERIVFSEERTEVFVILQYCAAMCKCTSHSVQVSEGKGRDWENEELAAIGEGQVRDHLRNLKLHKFPSLAVSKARLDGALSNLV